jgi:hypothetical protein
MNDTSDIAESSFSSENSHGVGLMQRHYEKFESCFRLHSRIKQVDIKQNAMLKPDLCM